MGHVSKTKLIPNMSNDKNNTSKLGRNRLELLRFMKQT